MFSLITSGYGVTCLLSLRLTGLGWTAHRELLESVTVRVFRLAKSRVRRDGSDQAIVKRHPSPSSTSQEIWIFGN